MPCQTGDPLLYLVSWCYPWACFWCQARICLQSCVACVLVGRVGAAVVRTICTVNVVEKNTFLKQYVFEKKTSCGLTWVDEHPRVSSRERMVSDAMHHGRSITSVANTQTRGASSIVRRASFIVHLASCQSCIPRSSKAFGQTSVRVVLASTMVQEHLCQNNPVK